MDTLSILTYFVFACIYCNAQQPYKSHLPCVKAQDLKFTPEYYSEKPDLSSPAITEKNREVLLLKTTGGKFTWLDVTVENGEPFDYKQGLYGKGNQSLADTDDFPHLAKTGIHSEKELFNTKLITGLSVAKITVDARPWGSSGVGFIEGDETIMSVIWADNLTVKKLGLTHPDIARPLFHFWNTIHDFEQFNLDPETNTRLELASFQYNGHEIEFDVQGSRGWQESIFNDEILGTGHIKLWRELTSEEQVFLEENYKHLTAEQMEELKKMLSYLHTGEMVLFYINRYGFYEGHNEYRVDPVTVAFLFGLKPIEELHRVTKGDLYGYFTMHFTENPE